MADAEGDFTLYDAFMYGYGIPRDQPLSDDMRGVLYKELGDLNYTYTQAIRSKDKIAAEAALQERKEQLKAMGDQRDFERSLQTLRLEDMSERREGARQAATKIIPVIDRLRAKIRPDTDKIIAAITGSRSISEQIKNMVGDPLLDQYRGLPGAEAKVHANLIKFGQQENLFEIKDGKFVATQKLKNELSDNSALMGQLKQRINATAGEYNRVQNRINESESFKQKMIQQAESEDLIIDQDAVEKAIAATRIEGKDPERATAKIALEIKSASEALQEQDKNIAEVESNLARVKAELDKAPGQEVRKAYAKAVANPNFRLWAESNGFNLGTSDGTVAGYSPGEDDGRAIILFGMQDLSGARLTPRTGRSVRYGGDVYTEERLTAYDVSRGKRRLYNPDTKKTIEVPIGDEITYMGKDIRLNPGERQQMMRNKRIDERREKRGRAEFLEDPEDTTVEQKEAADKRATQAEIERLQLELFSAAVSDDALILVIDDRFVFRNPKTNEVVSIDGAGRRLVASDEVSKQFTEIEGLDEDARQRLGEYDPKTNPQGYLVSKADSPIGQFTDPSTTEADLRRKRKRLEDLGGGELLFGLVPDPKKPEPKVKVGLSEVELSGRPVDTVPEELAEDAELQSQFLAEAKTSEAKRKKEEAKRRKEEGAYVLQGKWGDKTVLYGVTKDIIVYTNPETGQKVLFTRQENPKAFAAILDTSEVVSTPVEQERTPTEDVVQEAARLEAFDPTQKTKAEKKPSIYERFQQAQRELKKVQRDEDKAEKSEAKASRRSERLQKRMDKTLGARLRQEEAKDDPNQIIVEKLQNRVSRRLPDDASQIFAGESLQTERDVELREKKEEADMDIQTAKDERFKAQERIKQLRKAREELQGELEKEPAKPDLVGVG